jgi:cell pole-organizing protein PopZ
MPEHAKSPSEPSMEEIIASISRIITEDKEPKEPPPNVTGDAGDVFELTDAINEDGSVRRLAPFDKSSAAIGSSAAERDTSAIASAAEPQPKGADHSTPPRLEPTRERILSSATSGAAAAAFAQLGALPRERRKEGELPLGGAERTLEEIVRDLLRPLLQSWLDEHLPGIVERLVREEIARVVGEAGLR